MDNKEEIIWGRNFKDAPQSYWISSTSATNYPSLREDISADVAIVGGGMAGILTAYLLCKHGVKVVVLDADRILQGATGHTSAKLTSQHNLLFHKIKKKMGKDMAKQYAEANQSAINLIENIANEKSIDCDFSRQPMYVYTKENSYINKIEEEVETASDIGIKASYTETIPLHLNIKAALRFDNQAQFHPRKFLLALAKDISDKGGMIYENTKAVDIEEGKVCAVITDSGRKVTAESIVIASHYPFYDKPGLYFTRLYPKRAYAIGVRINAKYPGGMYASAESPIKAVRSQPYEGNELVIISGQEHKTGHGGSTKSHYEKLKEFSEETFNVVDMPYHWSTQDYDTADEIPYTGHLTSKTPNIFIAAGFSGWGMSNCAASSMILRDLILKGDSPWKDVYSPSRFTPVSSAKNFIMENADVAAQLISGKVLPAPEHVDIKPGEGKVTYIDGNKAGIYCDENGKLHFVDTTCTHLGCEVKWNDAEKTWDCPCHGSRYTYEGDVVEGPALKSIKAELKEKMYT